MILRHTLPDGSWHFDWLVESPGLEAVPTWRTGHARPDDPGVEAFEARRIGEHRRLYLDFEGEIAGGRGRVERVAWGEVVDAQWGEGELVLSADFAGRAARLVGRLIEVDRWRFVALHG